MTFHICNYCCIGVLNISQVRINNLLTVQSYSVSQEISFFERSKCSLVVFFKIYLTFRIGGIQQLSRITTAPGMLWYMIGCTHMYTKMCTR